MNTKQMRESIVMAKELDVAGEFVYAALEKINKIDTYEEVSDIFFILYHLSVGIERLQKILLVVLNDVELNKIQDFLENIKIHSHKKLHNQISNHIEISFSSAQNALLAVLAEFYAIFTEHCLVVRTSKGEAAISRTSPSKHLFYSSILFLYFNFSFHSASLKPASIVSFVTITGRFTNIPLVASSLNCSSSLIAGSLSLSCISL